MLDPDTIDHQQELLATYRRTLAHLLRQAAQHGGEAFAPPQVANGIYEARAQIQQIKAVLRKQGRDVSDAPGDVAKADHVVSLPATLEARNRNRLLQKVRTFWIEGVLQTALHDVTPIVLDLEARPDAVAHPWDTLLPYDGPSKQDLPSGTTILEVFDQAGGELLILGDPGAGKTIVLLKLASALLERAETDNSHPLPVVFHLGSWSAQQQQLHDWIIDELNQRYDVPRNLGQPWMTTDQILPLLDGLDEVPADCRTLCVAAINQFRQEHGLIGLVVCCRTHDYETLPNRLKVQVAVRLQPLTPSQIEAYVAQGGPQFAPLQRVLGDDPMVWDLARMPLLLNIMRLAYQGIAVEHLPAFDSIERRRTHLFTLYVERMFARPPRGRTTVPYTLNQTRRWLSWIAHMMAQHAQPTLMLDRMQPGWLHTRARRWLYFALVSLAVGLVVSLPGGLIGAIRGEPATGLLISLAIAIPLIHEIGQIVPVEALHWSWKQSLRGIGIGLTAGLAGGVMGGLYGGPAGALLLGLGTGIFGGMLSGIVFGLSGREIATRTTPNEGVWRSGRNAVQIWLAIGMSFGLGLALLGWVIDGMFGQQSFNLWFWLLNFGLPLGFIFLAPPLALARGGLVYIQHFALRFVLWCSGVLPWRCAEFLDSCVERVLLQRVGCSYIFIHRLLLEYFAALDTARSDEDPSTPPAQRERVVGT